MPPPSDFPRGWTLSTSVNGAGTATLTAPATPGVVHVLDSLAARITAYGATALYGPSLVVTTAAGNVIIWQQVVTGVAGSSVSDDLSLTGLDIASSVGGSIVVAYNTAAIANIVQNLVMQGHDI